MVPTLIVLGLLALGVGIVAFATRRTPLRIDSLRAQNDTAWTEPVAPAPPEAEPVDPFAHAPAPTMEAQPMVETTEPQSIPAERV